jgi:hypothetical protein
MFVVRDRDGNVVAYCSRAEDASALANTNLDTHRYIVEKVKK